MGRCSVVESSSPDRPAATGVASAAGNWRRLGLILSIAPVLSIAPLLRASSAHAATVIAEIDDIRAPGVRRELFRLLDSTPVRIQAEGLADKKGRTFLARGWVLDLESRAVIWEMDDQNGRYDDRSENWKVDDRLDLPPGSYALCFAATGGMMPLDEEIKIFSIPLGKIEASIGPLVAWNKLGDARRWHTRIEATGAYRAASRPVDPGPDPDAPIRLLGLGDDEVRRVRFDLDRPTELKLRMTGEYDRSIHTFADGAWITELSEWRRVWGPTFETTEPAGGDRKNRSFDGTFRLPAGNYLLTVATDGSHSAAEWNAPPPSDPEAWGAALDAARPGERDRLRLQPELGLPEPVVAIRSVGDDEFVRRPFTVLAPARVLVRGMGERGGRDEYADYGWIERLDDLDVVWSMDEADSEPAGGAAKNRLVETLLKLDQGGYALCYVSDDSHSADHWNAAAPREPDAWGISLAEFGRAAAWLTPEAPVPPSAPPPPGRVPRPPSPEAIPGGGDAGLLRPGEPARLPAVISLSPVGDDVALARRFRIDERMAFRLIALGEGDHDPLADRAWLEDEDGDVIWEMRYRDTSHAGGARKNRVVRAELTLPAGSYVLRYESDDSHAFGSWNAAAPRQPHLWGVTLIEKR